jgi:HSP20 family protein
MGISFGFSVTWGLGRSSQEEQPRGSPEAREIEVAEVREPPVDIMEEDDHLLVLADMPDIAVKSIALEVTGDLLSISASGTGRRYRREVLLPGSYQREQIIFSTHNGVLIIKCCRAPL